jgi:hypothetical protein
MLVVGVTLFRLVADRHWGAMLGIVGYLVGVPIAVSAFVSATSLVWTALDGPTTLAVAGVTAELHRFMLVNLAVGPFFIIVVGNTCMSLAAWRVAVLPRWLCIGVWSTEPSWHWASAPSGGRVSRPRKSEVH